MAVIKELQWLVAAGECGRAAINHRLLTSDEPVQLVKSILSKMHSTSTSHLLPLLVAMTESKIGGGEGSYVPLGTMRLAFGWLENSTAASLDYNPNFLSDQDGSIF